MTEILLAITMLLLGTAGVVLTLIGLPGTWLYLGCAMLALWIMPSQPFGWWTIGGGFLLCILAEVAEGVSGAMGAAKAGASKRALVGAAVGGLVGAIVGTFTIPIPIAGTLIGGALGSAIGAVILEITKAKNLRKSETLRSVATGAAIGRLLSTVIKSLFAIGLVILFTVASVIASG